MVFVFKLHKHFVHRLALYQVLAVFFNGLTLTLTLLFPIFHLEMNRWLCGIFGFLSFLVDEAALYRLADSSSVLSGGSLLQRPSERSQEI